jgi:predicted GNAT family acetyltransferase
MLLGAAFATKASANLNWPTDRRINPFISRSVAAIPAAPYSGTYSLCFIHHPMQHTIQHQEQDAKGAFTIENSGQRLAEMTYSRTNATMVIVDHTEVDPSLSGQGVGRELLDALVLWARATGTKVVPLCPFAKAQFDKDVAIRDVLV